ncbi:MAG TPA: hypothetical protein VF960_12870 [Chloroflexota bacterium]
MIPDGASPSIGPRSGPRAGRLSSSVAFALTASATAGLIALLLCWRIGEVPPLLNQDEAGFGLASYLLTTTGRDYFGNLLPAFVGYFDNHQLGGAMLAYWAIPFVKLFGLSIPTLRLSMVALSLVGLALFALLAWKLSVDRWVALAGTVLLATSPLFFMQSRQFLEMLLPIPFIVGWLICVRAYDARGDESLIVIAGAVLGLAYYSYGTARMVAPLYLALTLVLYLWLRKCSWRAAAGSVAVFCLLMVPAAVFVGREPHLYLERFRSLSWLSDGMTPPAIVAAFAGHYVAAFDPGDLFLRGDASLVHSTGRSGVFLLAGAPLALAGLITMARSAVRKRDGFSTLVLLSIALFPAPLALLEEVHSPARATYLLPLYGVVCVAGIQSLARWRPRASRGKALLLVLALAYTVEAGMFISDYFEGYPGRVLADAGVNGKDPAPFRALMAGAESQLFYDVEDTTTTTFARFFAAESGFKGALLPAPPAWADRLPPGGAVLTPRPDEYGPGFETVRTVPRPTPGRPAYTIIRKRATP